MESIEVWVAQGNAAADWPKHDRFDMIFVPDATVAKIRAFMLTHDLDVIETMPDLREELRQNKRATMNWAAFKPLLRLSPGRANF